MNPSRIQLQDVLSKDSSLCVLGNPGLMWNNERIRDIVLEYRRLAVSLNLRDADFQYDQTSVNAIKIALLFNDWNGSKKEELDAHTRLFISKTQELNSKWDSETRGKTYSLSDSSWIKFIEGMEKDTLIFLNENKIGNIEEVWFKRSEIK